MGTCFQRVIDGVGKIMAVRHEKFMEKTGYPGPVSMSGVMLVLLAVVMGMTMIVVPLRRIVCHTGPSR